MKALFKILSTGALLLATLSAAAQESVFPPGEFVFMWEDRKVDQFANLGLAIRAIRGEPGTSIRFLVLRPDGTQTYKTVVRDLVEYDPRERGHKR